MGNNEYLKEINAAINETKKHVNCTEQDCHSCKHYDAKKIANCSQIEYYYNKGVGKNE